MKKNLIFAFVAALSLSALTGCGDDDNGKLSGTYNKVIAEGESSYPTKITLEYKKPDYQVNLIIGNGTPRNLGVMTKSGDFLVKSDNNQKKMFEVKNDGTELMSLYTSTPSNYKKQGN